MLQRVFPVAERSIELMQNQPQRSERAIQCNSVVLNSFWTTVTLYNTREKDLWRKQYLSEKYRIFSCFQPSSLFKQETELGLTALNSKHSSQDGSTRAHTHKNSNKTMHFMMPLTSGSVLLPVIPPSSTKECRRPSQNWPPPAWPWPSLSCFTMQEEC